MRDLHPRFKLKEGQNLMVEQEGHLLRFESINANMQPFWLEAVSYTHLTLPTNREV